MHIKRLIGLLIAACCLLASPASAAVIYNGNTYLLTSASTTWTAAEAEAVTAGGHLAAINDASENRFLSTAFGSSSTRLWIGFNDVATEGTFVWSNGDAVTYTNWAVFELNNLGGEDYTVINWGAGGTWNDCRGARCATDREGW